MDTAFFLASKIIWALISPDSLIVILGIAAWLALVMGWNKLGRRLLSLCVLLLVVIGFLPVGEWLLAPLENRFSANTALPAEADGIIVLGGAIAPTRSQAWNQVQLGAGADRMTNFVYLANLYPGAQLVFTGGNGSVLQQDFKEADSAQTLLNQLALEDRAIIFESESRNTAENAVNSMALVNPTPDQNWILITSAFHMPRSVGVFCAQDWPVTPYPVDYYSERGRLWRIEFAFADNLSELRTAIREWVGLVAYRVTGRSAQLWPGDNSYCGLGS